MNIKLFLFFLVFLISGCGILQQDYTWCECKDYSLDGISYSVLRGKDGGTIDLDAIETCAEKVIDLLDFNMKPKEMTVDFIQQVSWEICENGFYKGKGSDNRGKKYYE